MARSILAVALAAFWQFVAWSGGPTHRSYSHARWRVWQEREVLRRFLRPLG